MILKYPIFLLLLIPVIGMVFYFRSVKTIHAIRFPKASSLAPLASKKGKRLLSISKYLEIIIIVLIIFTLAQPQYILSKKFNTKKRA